MRNIAIILAGGTGVRAGGDRPKQLRLLPNGKTVLETCVDAFVGQVDAICVVIHADHMAETRRLLADRDVMVVAGGRERWESSWNALQALGEQEVNVLIHDAARPFVSSRIIADVCRALEEHEAVTVAVPATDTLYRVANNCVADIPPRAEFMRAQTPQAFRLSLIRKAYEIALQDPDGVYATDDCGIVKRYLPEVPIYIVPGEENNKKLTYKEDFD
ncbi:MAG: 2-C-methyl-D-erythritol 4-phosphate cytidylyltransferase [Paludibacteraceae bacterium]|nr:2-C-methyl-D-erythritol 4-phosphate cytidylyltransferase [Paludibacteraceae bacterium]